MTDLIEFFRVCSNLKFYPRRGWILRGVKNPETIADHGFMVFLLAWIFSFGRNFNERRLLKIALVHSLPAVYLQSITSYDHLLKVRSKSEILKKYPALVLRGSVQKKEEIFERRLKEEKNALDNLLKIFPSWYTKEIEYLWEDFRLGQSREAKFLSEIDKIENLIQAILYKDQLKKEGLGPFWSQAEEITNDGRLLRFMRSLKEYSDKGASAVKSREDAHIINFVFQAAKLKSIKRKGWILRGVKNPDSIASHSFIAALIAWFFSERRKYDQVVIMLMIIFHNLYAVEIGDVTPYDSLLEQNKDVKEVVEKFPWLGMSHEKEVILKKSIEKEGQALDKIIGDIPHHYKHEIKYLWLEFKTGASKEARFARQVDRIETIIQAMEYYRKDKSISVASFWKGLKELIDDRKLQEFVSCLDDYYFHLPK